MKLKEEKRVFVLQQVIQGKITVGLAAATLHLTKRQVFRLKKRLQKHGLVALAHRNRGRKPKHAVSKEIRERIVSLAQGDYSRASCEHMAELLAKREGIVLSPKTIGRILKAAQIANFHAHRAARRRRSRERRSREGMLSQCDASPFDWLEGRGPQMSLHGCIDDATSKVQGLYFRLHEDIVGYLKMLEQVVTKFGVPQALYSDRHTIFFSPKTDKLSLEEELAGRKAPLTQFGRALEKLGIHHIPARSPQAKGRAERLWGTLQHRLVIELRLAEVSTMEEANAFLPGFIQRFNARFSVAAKEPKSAYLPTPPRKELDTILCRCHRRTASGGSTISFQNQRYGLIDTRGKIVLLRPGHDVWVIEHLDGTKSALYQEKRYYLKTLSKPKPAAELNPAKERPSRPAAKPLAEHPWKQKFDAKRRLVAQKRKEEASLYIPCEDRPELSAIEQETFHSLSEIFGVEVVVRNKKGQHIRLSPE